MMTPKRRLLTLTFACLRWQYSGFRRIIVIDVFLKNTSTFEQINLTTKFDPNQFFKCCHEFFDPCQHSLWGLDHMVGFAPPTRLKNYWDAKTQSRACSGPFFTPVDCVYFSCCLPALKIVAWFQKPEFSQGWNLLHEIVTFILGGFFSTILKVRWHHEFQPS